MKPYYDYDGITIYHGDCREVLPSLPNNSIDFIFTDPPYGHRNNDGDLISKWEEALGETYRGKKVKSGDPRPIANDDEKSASELVQFLFRQSNRLLARGGCCCCCCGGGGGPDPQFAHWSLWMDQELGFKHAVVWDKGGLGMGWHYRRNYELVLVGEKKGGPCKWYGGRTQPNVIRIPGIKPAKEDHPIPKPQALVNLFIGLHSQVNDLVLDPFMGSGTTLRAAKDLRRRAIGIEIEEKYCEIAAKRMEQQVIDFPEPAKVEQLDLLQAREALEGKDGGE